MCWLYYADFGLKLKISLFKKKQHAHIHANSLKKIALPKLLSLPKKFKWPPPPSPGPYAYAYQESYWDLKSLDLREQSSPMLSDFFRPSGDEDLRNFLVTDKSDGRTVG